MLELVPRPRLRRRQQRERRTERAGLEIRSRGRQRAPGPPLGFGRQPYGSVQERGCSGHATPRLGATRRPLELGSDLFVRAGRCLGQVPRPPIGIDRGVGRLRQHPVRIPPLLGRRRQVNGRAHQRVAKPHPRPDLEQPSRLRGLQRCGRHAERPSRPPQERRIAGRLRRRHQQQPPGALGQSIDPRQEALLNPAFQRQRPRQPEPAGQLSRR